MVSAPYNRTMNFHPLNVSIQRHAARLRFLIGVFCAATSFCAGAAIPASEQVVAVEFYHAGLDHYFISAAPGEINDLDTGVHAGWVRTGYRFAVIRTGSTYPSSVPMCRFYNPTQSTHFYTAKASECDDVKVKFAAAWQFESGEVFRAFLVDPSTGACPADTTPVYRLYNNRPDVNHRYTDQLSVFLFMKGKSYIPEGDGSPATPVAYCTPAGGDVVPPAPALAPKCTINPSSNSPAPGSILLLTAVCTNAPTGVLWAGCTSTQGTCNATKATAGAATYTLYSANAQGPGDPATLTVTWVDPAPPPPPPPPPGQTTPQCSLSAPTLYPGIGTQLTLTASCSPTATSYQWLQCSQSNLTNCSVVASCSAASSSCNVTSSTAGPGRYIVTGTNSVGSGPWVQLDMEWQNSAAYGGFCGQYVRVKEFGMPWGSSDRFVTGDYGGFTDETVFVVDVTIPSSPSSYGTPGYTSLAEYKGPPAYRHMTLSKTKCDFRTPDPTGVNGPFDASAGPSVLINWNVGAQPLALTPGQTYYFNVRNLGCGQASCEASMSSTWPH